MYDSSVVECYEAHLGRIEITKMGESERVEIWDGLSAEPGSLGWLGLAGAVCGSGNAPHVMYIEVPFLTTYKTDCPIKLHHSIVKTLLKQLGEHENRTSERV